MGDGGNAKIREQNFLVLPDKHILWLDITMGDDSLRLEAEGFSGTCLNAPSERKDVYRGVVVSIQFSAAPTGVPTF